MVYRVSIRYRFPLSNAKDNAPNACDNENAEYPKKKKQSQTPPNQKFDRIVRLHSHLSNLPSTTYYNISRTSDHYYRDLMDLIFFSVNFCMGRTLRRRSSRPAATPKYHLDCSRELGRSRPRRDLRSDASRTARKASS